MKVLPELTHAAPRFPDVAQPMVEAWEASLKKSAPGSSARHAGVGHHAA